MPTSFRGLNEIALSSPLLSPDGSPKIALRPLADRRRKAIAQAIQALRVAIDGGIPAYGSLIGLEIFLFICEHDFRGEPIRLKDLYLNLSRSQGGVRRIVRRLEADGWIVVESSEQDRRTSVVVPSDKLREMFAYFTVSPQD